MLAGGGCLARGPNFGEAEVVGGDNLLGGFPPAGGACPEVIVFLTTLLRQK